MAISTYLITLIIITVTILSIGVSLPFTSAPDMQFGVRIKRNPEIDIRLRSLKIQFISVNIISAAIVFGISYEFVHGMPLLLSVQFPMLDLVSLYLAYLYVHRKVRKIRASDANQGLEKNKVSAYVPKENGSVARKPNNLVLFLFPWIEFLVFLAIGLLYYPRVPEVMTTHWTAGGVPNGFESKSYLNAFFLLITVNIPVTLIMELIGYMGLRVTPPRSMGSSRRSHLQIRGFNSRMLWLMTTIDAIIQFTIFLESAQEWGAIHVGSPLILSLFPVLAIIPIVVFFSLRTGQGGWKLYPGARDNGSDAKGANDDSKWIAGLIYHDKENPSLLTPKRFGVGYALNFGRKTTWVIMGAALSLPILIRLLIIFHIF